MNSLLWWCAQTTMTTALMVPTVLLACRLFRRRPAVQHLLWLVVLLKFVTPPIVAWPWTVDDLKGVAWSQNSRREASLVDSLADASQSEKLAESPIVTPPLLESRNPNDGRLGFNPAEPSEYGWVPVDDMPESSLLAAHSQWGGVATFSLFAAWMVGVVACVIRLKRRLVCCDRLVDGGRPAPSHLIDQVNVVASRLGVNSPVCVVVQGITSPFLWCFGVVRMVWPETISNSSDVVRSRGIIAHELAHLRRRDHWVTWLEMTAAVIWWWNPLLGFVRSRLRETAEMSCDALAIATDTENRCEYAERLLEYSSRTGSDGAALVLGVGEGSARSFQRRLEMILTTKVSGKLTWHGALAMVFLFAISLPYWSWAQTKTDSQVAVGQQAVGEQAGSKQAAVPSNGNQERTVQFKLIDGSTGTPLQGLEVTFGAIGKPLEGDHPTAPASSRIVGSATSDSDGVIEIEIRDGETPYLKSASAGWFFRPIVFKVEADDEAGNEAVNATDPTIVVHPPGTSDSTVVTPHTVELWSGTEVTGRLLWPDGSPATGVRLSTGVYINNQTWKKRLGMDLRFYSFDHGDWPNWSHPVVTNDQGRFNVTVPPEDARSWFRVGTTGLSFGAIHPPTVEDVTHQKLSHCIPFEYQIGGHSRSGTLRVDALPAESGRHLQLGDLRMETGVHVAGRVLDSSGTGLVGVRLTTTGAHGPHSGRGATSGPDGNFEFLAIAPGTLTVHPDARLRDENGQVISRDVQAVFVDQSFDIPRIATRHQITIRAVPHTEVVFRWVDRRQDTTQPIAYYGTFRLRGYMPDANGEPSIYWTGETVRTQRDGKSLLVVKVPTALLNPQLILSADRKVTASYADSAGLTSGPGVVALGDLSAPVTRTIFGDEPRSADDK